MPSASRVFTVAGIARPERFFADVTSVGWEIVGSMTFRDHHRFTPRDVERIRAAARSCSAAIVLTTEKDAVRLGACDLGGLPVASVPLHVGVEPPETFRDWLMERLHAAAGIAADRLQSGIAPPPVRR